MAEDDVRLDIPTRVLHLGLLAFGVTAWWIGEDAGDYHKPVHDGYLLHMYVGLGFALFLALRLLYGFFGPRESRFGTWVPYTRERFAYVKADLVTLRHLKLPEPVTHRGLNAAVQSLGLLLFTWQGASGTLMSMTLVPGERAVGWLHDLKEIHQAASVWIPTYLVLHVGAAVLHALTGRHIWKKMVFLE
ncbi:MAG TPA: cytochrome b/b6 domain-containing protein [Gammaproteobacteria bacterium]|nr:cytochrome b/b6 domain-containing protein [Gammaproteobacteria bacterium]